MKKFTDILKDVHELETKIKAAKQYEDDLDAKLGEKPSKEEIDAYSKAISTNEQKLNDYTVCLHILHNNAKIALFNEVVTIALDVLNKYAGKPYGEKTRQKISDEVMEKTKCRCYIRCSYSIQTLEIMPSDFYNYNYSISVGLKDRKSQCLFLVDNKIQKIGYEELELWYISDEYVEDVQKRADELNAAYAQILAVKEELKNCCTKFNTLAVGDIKHINEDEHLYNKLIR